MKVFLLFSCLVALVLSWEDIPNHLMVNNIVDAHGSEIFGMEAGQYFGPKGCAIKDGRVNVLFSVQGVLDGGIASWDASDISGDSQNLELQFNRNIDGVDEGVEIMTGGQRNFTVSGLTIDKDGNYQVVGLRLLRVHGPYEPKPADTTYKQWAQNPNSGYRIGSHNKIEPVMLTFADNEPDVDDSPSAHQIMGPVAFREPLSLLVSGATFDKDYDTYWVVDPESSMLWQAQLTCCDEVEDGVNRRWEHQLKVRRGCGLKYGLHSDRDWFAKRGKDETKFAHPPPEESQKSLIASPGLSSVTGVAVDPVNGNLWIVNNFPTTTLYHINRQCEVEVAYNLEAVTGGLKDASCVAVTEESIFVGFEMEEKLVEIERPACEGDNDDMSGDGGHDDRSAEGNPRNPEHPFRP